MKHVKFEAAYYQPDDLYWLQYDEAGDCYKFKTDEAAGSIVAVIAFHAVNASYATVRRLLTSEAGA